MDPVNTPPPNAISNPKRPRTARNQTTAAGSTTQDLQAVTEELGVMSRKAPFPLFPKTSTHCSQSVWKSLRRSVPPRKGLWHRLRMQTSFSKVSWLHFVVFQKLISSSQRSSQNFNPGVSPGLFIEEPTRKSAFPARKAQRQKSPSRS